MLFHLYIDMQTMFLRLVYAVFLQHTWSAAAIAYAEHQPVILIDGEKLVQLMIEYNVGVTTRQTYEVKRLDLDYFSEDE